MVLGDGGSGDGGWFRDLGLGSGVRLLNGKGGLYEGFGFDWNGQRWG